VGTIYRRRSARFRHTVHPHGRGDNYAPEEVARHLDGSPPRAWGQSGTAPPPAARGRFTPTGVGTMVHCSSRYSASAVHPHGRGDNELRCGGAPWAGGSPPRAWGQCPSTSRDASDRRFTPTGVGTMPGAKWLSCPLAVHPHGRGDNGCFGV